MQKIRANCITCKKLEKIKNVLILFQHLYKKMYGLYTEVETYRLQSAQKPRCLVQIFHQRHLQSKTQREKSKVIVK